MILFNIHSLHYLLHIKSDFIKILRFPVTNSTKYGIHGYDNNESSMHAIFMAKGPLFAKGKQIKSVKTVDLYNLFCVILNINCNHNDGTNRLSVWNDLFVNKSILSVRTDRQNDRHRVV